MDELRGLDKVAYVRFASVYREFSDVSQFVDTLQSLDSHTLTKQDLAKGALLQQQVEIRDPAQTKH